MLTGETDGYLLASCLEAGALGWIGKGNGSGRGRRLDRGRRRRPVADRLRDSGGPCSTSSARIAPSLGRVDAPLPAPDIPRANARLGALIEGMSAEEIAETHFVALTTIRSQIRAILHKLGVRSQLAAVAQALPASPAAADARASARRGSMTASR